MISKGIKEAVAEDVMEYVSTYNCSIEDAIVDIYYSIAEEGPSLTDDAFTEILAMVKEAEEYNVEDWQDLDGKWLV
jgi:hypothetical protein